MGALIWIQDQFIVIILIVLTLKQSKPPKNKKKLPCTLLVGIQIPEKSRIKLVNSSLAPLNAPVSEMCWPFLLLHFLFQVMATWKLNRKYPATVISFDAESGNYLVEFYDQVQSSVRPHQVSNCILTSRGGVSDIE